MENKSGNPIEKLTVQVYYITAAKIPTIINAILKD